MQITENLKWRYAIKKYDKSRKIAPTDLEKIKEAVRYSASSYGLQLYKILIIEDEEVREKLRAASFDQEKVTDASHLVVLCNYTNPTPDGVDKYVKLTAETRNQDIEALEGFSKTMKKSIEAKGEEVDHWTENQVYIALGTLLAAASELKIDSSPMEGFKPSEYNKILGLEERGLNAAVIAAIGYRSEEDTYHHQAKVRKPSDELFETI